MDGDALPLSVGPAPVTPPQPCDEACVVIPTSRTYPKETGVYPLSLAKENISVYQHLEEPSMPPVDGGALPLSVGPLQVVQDADLDRSQDQEPNVPVVLGHHWNQTCDAVDQCVSSV